MTTPLLDVSDTQLPWQEEDQRKLRLQQTQQQQDQITPDSSSLTDQTYYDRLNTIRQDSATATAGAIASDQVQKQRDAALKAAQLAKAQADAQQSAMNNLYSFSSGGPNGAPGGSVAYDGTDQARADMMRKAGFPESAIGIGLGIIQAESSGNPNATHRNANGSIDNGLWQINTIHQGNSYYPQNPMDPQQSTNAAYAIWKAAGGKFTDWTTYNQGLANAHPVPPIRPYVASTSNGLQNAQISQAQAFNGIPTSAARAQAINISKQVLNIPYVWGGNSLKSGVDCSGLVQQVYSQMGISMPRQARAQATTGVRVQSYNQLQPGDLVAFQWAGGYAGAGTVSHISIYLGNGQIIEAAGGAHGDIRNLGNSAEDRGAIYIHTRFPGE